MNWERNHVVEMSGTLDQARRTLRKHEVVFQSVVHAIRSGALAPGARLPNETELAEQYGVSRTCVRRGLLRLQKEGLVETRQGSGSYVRRSGRFLMAEARNVTLGVRYLYESTESRALHANGPFRSFLQEGLEYAAGYHGLHLVEDLGGWGSFSPVTVRSSDSLVGLITVAFVKDDPADLMADLPRAVPRLLVNRASKDPAIPFLSVDRELGIYEATSFLLTLGHRRIGIDLLENDSPPALERQRGYRRAFQAAGLPVDETMIFQGVGGLPYVEWPNRLRELLRRDRRPTALILHHANRVVHIMDVLQSASIRVPHDLSLIIIDDDPVLSRMTPRLSAISVPYVEMGRRAVTMILEEMRNAREVPHVLLEPQLIMRESVAPPNT